MKRMDSVIELITYDATGARQYRTILAFKRGVPRGEFFAAGQNDIRSAYMFEVWSLEYKDEKQMRYDGKIYSIYRAYPKEAGRTELYCEVRLGEH